MPNKFYRRGVAHEYAIKRKWEKDGWTVLRTAGSHGEFDLIAIKKGTGKTLFTPFGLDIDRSNIVLIQAKSGKSAERERKKLEPLKDKYEGIYSVRVELL